MFAFIPKFLAFPALLLMLFMLGGCSTYDAVIAERGAARDRLPDG